jgi:hypothetical protein
MIIVDSPFSVHEAFIFTRPCVKPGEVDAFEILLAKFLARKVIWDVIGEV